jgi:hypothetical protein
MYGMTISEDDPSAPPTSMTERLFNYFQMMANASEDTKYVKEAKSQGKHQKGNKNPGSGLYTLLTLEDILYAPEATVLAYGCKFLTLDLEIFRKHLCALDKGETDVIEKDQNDFKIIAPKIRSKTILSSFKTPIQYLQYLGIDRDISTPIHNVMIYASLQSEEDPTETIITKPTPDQLIELATLVQTLKTNPVSFNTVMKPPIAYRRTIIYGSNNALDTYTKISDGLTGKVYTHQKIFRNIWLPSLPVTPILSEYGSLPSTWLFIINTLGQMDIMLVTNGLEVITKHFALAYKNRDVIVAGELHRTSQGDLIVNIRSGTYMVLLFSQTTLDKKILPWLKKYLKFHWQGEKSHIYYTDKDIVSNTEKPYKKEMTELCDEFPNRLLIQNPSLVDRSVSEKQYQHEVASSTSVCDRPGFLQQFDTIDDMDLPIEGLKRIV